MQHVAKTLSLSFLMIVLSLSAAMNSLNEEVQAPIFEEPTESMKVILAITDLNESGFQEGSIFTDSTLSSGGDHTCAIIDNGSVSCWGLGDKGQLGNGGTSDQYSPTLVIGLGTGRSAVSISSGYSHTCAVLDNGDVMCWGENNVGQLGNGGTFDTAIPTLTNSLGFGRTAVAISTGIDHTCALLDNGLISCWGGGNYGQLGNGANYDSTYPTLTNTLGSGQTVVALSSGGYHNCAILVNGKVTCWGFGSVGQLGNGATSIKNTPTLTNSLGSGLLAVAITTGEYFTCALLNDASVSCWGSGSNGQLGNGATSDSTTPTPTSSLGSGATAIAISAGNRSMCALLNNGDLTCWGYGGDGQLGNGDTSDKTVATTTNSLGAGRTPVAISSGLSHTCAILDNGEISCWGDGTFGRLGNGGTTTQNSPMLTSGFAGMQKVALSERDFDGDGILNIFDGRQSFDYSGLTLSSGYRYTCAILDDGSVSCWGMNTFGQLGDGTTTERNTPTQTSNLGIGRTAVAISSGASQTCALLDDGTVRCWGRNNYGQIGDGTTIDRDTPTQSLSLGTGRTAVAITSGDSHACAVLDDGSVRCWGNNDNGELGDGTNTNRNTPTQTFSLGTGRTAVAISAGGIHTCAVLDDGSVVCWGDNFYGQLGGGNFGNSNDRNIPTQTSSLGTGRTAVAISAGGTQTCAILDDGSVRCWGDNWFGQLGDGGNNNRNTPTQTSSLGTGRTAVVISSGWSHTCAVLDDESVSCWGYNAYGQIGDGTNTNRNTPTQTWSLGTGRTAVSISSGLQYSCATLDNASVSCWGANGDGRLGDGTNTTRSTPAQTASLGTGRTVLLDEGDKDNDGTSDDLDDFPNDSIRSIACTSGQYGRYLCVDSPAGKYVPSSSAMYATDCAAGTYQSTIGQTSCDNADAGYYVPTTSQIGQTACSAGTYQTLTGQTSCNYAEAGYYVPTTAQTSQIPCAIGTHQTLTGMTSCNDADTGYYVPTTAQTSQTACANGTYQALTGQGSCDDADAGYYVPTTAQSSQIPCVIGTYQASTGQTSCDDADAGYYVPTTAQSGQTACSAGTYQSLTGQTSCDDADAGYYVSTIAQTSQTECAIGTFQVLTGQASCDDADAGYYVPTTTQTSQTECTIGTYQSLTGQGFCDDADAGYYVPTTAQSSQIPCATGTYQALTGQTSCDDADPGHYVGLPGQFDQPECLAGTYQPAEKQSSCIDASIGFYVLLNGAVEQTVCPYQTSTIEIGSKLMSDCLIDTDFDLLPDVTDSDDDADGTLDIDDAFPLDASEDKDSDGDGRGDNMQKLAEAKQMRMILIAVVLLLVTASIIGTFMMRSRKEDEESDWRKEDYLFDEVDHMKQPQIPPQPTPPPQPTIPPMENKVDYVATWQELPTGHWLEYDENGTNWYKANDGTHWYSSEGGYRLWKDNR